MHERNTVWRGDRPSQRVRVEEGEGAAAAVAAAVVAEKEGQQPQRSGGTVYTTMETDEDGSRVDGYGGIDGGGGVDDTAGAAVAGLWMGDGRWTVRKPSKMAECQRRSLWLLW